MVVEFRASFFFTTRQKKMNKLTPYQKHILQLNLHTEEDITRYLHQRKWYDPDPPQDNKTHCFERVELYENNSKEEKFLSESELKICEEKVKQLKPIVEGDCILLVDDRKDQRITVGKHKQHPRVFAFLLKNGGRLFRYSDEFGGEWFRVKHSYENDELTQEELERRNKYCINPEHLNQFGDLVEPEKLLKKREEKWIQLLNGMKDYDPRNVINDFHLKRFPNEGLRKQIKETGYLPHCLTDGSRLKEKRAYFFGISTKLIDEIDSGRLEVIDKIYYEDRAPFDLRIAKRDYEEIKNKCIQPHVTFYQEGRRKKEFESVFDPCIKWDLRYDFTIRLNGIDYYPQTRACEYRWECNKPDGQYALHFCGNTLCCNKNHLYFGSIEQNSSVPFKDLSRLEFPGNKKKVAEQIKKKMRYKIDNKEDDYEDPYRSLSQEFGFSVERIVEILSLKLS